jgi:hypothetical protein
LTIESMIEKPQDSHSIPRTKSEKKNPWKDERYWKTWLNDSELTT